MKKGRRNMDLFTIQSLCFCYPEAAKPALNKLSLSIRQGELLLLCGASGGGKSTLLRHLKPALSPMGTMEGAVLFCDEPLGSLSPRHQAEKIGYLLQSPDNQMVTDKVWHELAFGLESLGLPNPQIRLRVAETAAFFGIEGWFHRATHSLSGGQKQLLNLAAILAMQPEVLLLDEPTAQLDPIAAQKFLELLKRINTQLGVTIVLSEHRLEEAFPLADRVVVLEHGQVLAEGTPQTIGNQLQAGGSAIEKAFPSAMQIFRGVRELQQDHTSSADTLFPVTVGAGRAFLQQRYPQGAEAHTATAPNPTKKSFPIITLEEVYFKYEKEGSNILEGLSLRIPEGEIFAVLGGNGMGKSTMLSLITGSNRAYRGKVLLRGKRIERYTPQQLFDHLLGFLPQNPQSMFVKSTVEQDLMMMPKAQQQLDALQKVILLLGIEPLLASHPYDLSGGEQQKVALAKLLLLDPQILLLDEPTKGLDGGYKEQLGQLLQTLVAAGKTVLLVSHDLEFCARFATRCALCFNGQIIAQGTPRSFFSGNSFYTTAANRIARGVFPEAITNEEVIALCRQHPSSARSNA